MDLVTVGEYPTDFEAELARQLLESNGIHACVSGGMQVLGASNAAGFVGGVVQVAGSDRKRAVRILQSAKRPKEDVPGPAWEGTLGKVAFWSFIILVPLCLLVSIVVVGLSGIK